MNTKEFLERIWEPDGYHIISFLTPDKRMRNKAFPTIEEAAAFAARLDAAGAGNVYCACAVFSDIRRVKNNVKSLKAWWCDFDCDKESCYTTKAEGLKALDAWLVSTGMPRPMVIDSGHGYHLYWLLTRAVTPAVWLRGARGLKALMQVNGLRFDPPRAEDMASLLRPVGMHNRKDPDNPVVVTLESDAEAVDAEVILAITDKVLSAEAPVAPVLGAAPAFLSVDDADPLVVEAGAKYSGREIAKKCLLMQKLRDTQGDVDYETWRLLVGLLTFCEEGLPLAEEWSARRAETGHEQTDTKARFTSWSSGPSTCEALAGACAGNCTGCPFRRKIKTPLILGRLAPENKREVIKATMEEGLGDTEVTEEIPPFPEGYTWSGKSLIRWVKSETKGTVTPRVFCRQLFYLAGRIRTADGQYEYVVRFHLPGDKPVIREFMLPGDIIGQGGPKLLGLLGSKELMLYNNEDAAKNMSAYLRDQVDRIAAVKGVLPTYSSFGWQADGSFLIGKRLYKPDGTISSALLSGYAEDVQGALPPPKGTIEGYARALNAVYNREGMEPMQYVILSMMASPLVGLYDKAYCGIPVALTGAASGRGKTTACKAALYAFGDAMALTVAGDVGATPKARSAFLGTLSDLPALFDEVTSMKPEALSQLAYALSNGTEPMRLRVGQGGVRFAGRESWHLQAALTGNTYIGARLAENGQTEAEAMRLFEIRVDSYNIPKLEPLAVAKQLTEMSHNAGAVGDAYIKWVVNHKAEVSELFAEVSTRIPADSALMADPKYRFFRDHVILTMSAAKIMKSLGVIHFDLDKLFTFAVRVVGRLIDLTEETNTVDYADAIQKMMTDYQQDIFQSEYFRLPKGSSPYTPRIKNQLVGRLITPNMKSYKEPFAGELLISAPAVGKWCVEHRVDRDALWGYLQGNGVTVNQRRLVRLGTSTIIPTLPTRCWELNYKLLCELIEKENGSAVKLED